MASRRPREQIDRRYLIADVLIKTGSAGFWLLLLIAAGTPFGLADVRAGGLWDYAGVMAMCGALSGVLLIAGRRLRAEATHWDVD